MKAVFNYDKSAVMAMLGNPPPESDSLGCGVVTQHRLLGCLLDDMLQFTPLLKETLRKARGLFVELFHAAETGVFLFQFLLPRSL